MSARAYLVRLTLLIFVFVIVLPGAVVGLLYGLEHSPGSRNAALGFGYAAFFLGIPLWILCFAIALWRATRARALMVGLPAWVPLSLVVMVAADWRLFLWMFRPLFAPFLCGVFVLLMALAVLPDRATGSEAGSGHRAAVWAWGFFTVLACASLAASLIWSMTLTMPAFSVDASARRLAFWWVFVVCGALVWAIAESRARLRT